MPSVTQFPPLGHDNRTMVGTQEAAYHLDREAHTLRKWACYENGPLRPVRINGRLGWRVADILRILSEGGAA